MTTKRILSETQKERKRLKERERKARIKAEKLAMQAPVEQAPESALQVEPDPAPESAFNRVLDHSDFLRLKNRH